jgi:hypothetical protein
MPRHESVTDEYVADLKAKLQEAFHRVKTAPNWPGTQKQMVAGSHAYLTALNSVEAGWSHDQIALDLAIRTGLGKLAGYPKVIGNTLIDEAIEN